MALQLEDKKAIVVGGPWGRGDCTLGSPCGLSRDDRIADDASTCEGTRCKCVRQGSSQHLGHVGQSRARTSNVCVKCSPGPSLLVLSRDDPGAGGAVDERLSRRTQTGSSVRAYRARRPTREWVRTSSMRWPVCPLAIRRLAMLLGVMKAPIGKMARTLKEIPAKLVRTLAAVRDNKRSVSRLVPARVDSTDRGTSHMAISKDDILNAVAAMSVMDVVELVKAMEEKFGVTAAAAVAAAPAGCCTRRRWSEVEEQTEFAVILAAAGEKKVNVIKAVRTVTSLGLEGSQGSCRRRTFHCEGRRSARTKRPRSRSCWRRQALLSNSSNPIR